MIKDNSAQDNAVQQQYIQHTSEIILDVFNKLLFWSQENKIVVSFTIFYIDFENSLQRIKDLEKECWTQERVHKNDINSEIDNYILPKFSQSP